MVRTFEVVGNELKAEGTSDSLWAASASLPQGAYTTLRTYGGDRVFGLERHTARLGESAAQLGAARPELEQARVRMAIALALRASRHAESRLRLTWAPPRLFVSVEPFVPPPPALYDAGVWCVTVGLRRERPQAKDTRFLEAAATGYERLPPGAHEGLMVAEDGSLLEGLSSNFYAVCAGVLRTDGARVLQGVTRALVLEIAAGLLPVETTAVRLGQLSDASEAFITSVSRGIVPVVRIDERPIGDGRPGPITRELMRRFQALAEREAVSVNG